MKAPKKTLKTIITPNRRALCRALCTLLVGIAALWAMPRSARARLYISQVGNNTVGEFNATTGAVIKASFITGLNFPWGLALSGNKLFVANEGSDTVGNNTVGKYNAATGAAINPSFITGLSDPAGLAVAPVPEPSTWSMIAVGGVALLGIMRRKKHRSA
jgi:hypothetical protein